LRASYHFNDKDLFVRATVTSTLPPDNPVFKDQKQKRQAWVQPVVPADLRGKKQ
jgi:hypothetical protein